MKKTIAFLLALIFAIAGYSQFSGLDTTLEQVVVTRKLPNNLSYSTARITITIDTSQLQLFYPQSVTALLEQMGNIDIRQRGADETQADVSIRAGNFDQVLILLDGVNITDFQTGHHSLNLPVPMFSIQSLEILEGPAARIFGANSFSGVIDIKTASPDVEPQVKGLLEMGQYGLAKVESAIFFGDSTLSTSIDLSKSLSSGYAPNTDFDITKAFITTKYNPAQNIGVFSLKAGFLGKNAGAYNFYTPLFPYQYESIISWLAIISHDLQVKPGFKLHTDLYQRTHSEIFELFREDPNWYVRTDSGYFVMGQDTAKYYPGIYQPWNYYREHNFHLTTLWGAKTSAKYHLKKAIINTALEARYEQIRSNKLGEPSDSVRFPFYQGAYMDKFASRLNLNASANILVNAGPVDLSFGGLLAHSSQYGTFFFPGADISLNLGKWIVYSSYNQSMREPTFTDLYYSGPANIGNPDLKPETATTYESGLKKTGKLNLKAAVFYRQGRNIIDWVRETPEDKWQTMNYTKLDTYGFELWGNLKLDNDWLGNIFFSYKYNNQTKPQTELLSKYVLDYMKNYASVALSGKHGKFGYFLDVSYNDRNGSFELYNPLTGSFTETPYSPYVMINFTGWYELKKLKFFVSVDNLLDQKYYDISNVLLPGRWIKIGFTMNQKLK